MSAIRWSSKPSYTSPPAQRFQSFGSWHYAGLALADLARALEGVESGPETARATGTVAGRLPVRMYTRVAWLTPASSAKARIDPGVCSMA